jgi:hypothetical protein
MMRAKVFNDLKQFAIKVCAMQCQPDDSPENFIIYLSS